MSRGGENPGGLTGSYYVVRNTYYELCSTNPEQKANSGRHGHLGFKGTPRAPGDANKTCTVAAIPPPVHHPTNTRPPSRTTSYVRRTTFRGSTGHPAQIRRARQLSHPCCGHLERQRAPTIRQPPSSMHLPQDSLDRRSCDPDDLRELIGAGDERR